MRGILCFGDSITFGRGENPSIGWVGRLKNWFEVQDEHNGVYNLGISGQSSIELLKRFDIEADARLRIKSDEDQFTILIAIGANDTRVDFTPNGNVSRCTPEDFDKNIKELLKKAKSKKAQIGVIGLMPMDEAKSKDYHNSSFENARLKQYHQMIQKRCKEAHIPFLDIFDQAMKENYIMTLEDGIHPNDKGYDMMFKHIREFLIKDNLLPITEKESSSIKKAHNITSVQARTDSR